VTLPTVAVLVPVLDRPHRVAPLAESIDHAATVPTRILFLCSPDDQDEIDAVHDAGQVPLVVPWRPGQGDYARKINHGYRYAVAAGVEWSFLAADDLRFHPAWDAAAIETGRDLGVCVVGTNDRGNPKVIDGRHATHSLVHRDYLECGTADEDGLILHEGYWHNWVDNEFVETARARGTFAPSANSVVEHLHPVWGKGEEDATYARGREHYHPDRRLFDQRRRLWT
jgi:hypothetical protein